MLLAARHPCNHLYVQELALRAALAETLTGHTSTVIGPQVPHSDAASSGDLYRAAQQIAQSSLSVEERLTYASAHPILSAGCADRHALGPVATAALHRRSEELLRGGAALPEQPPADRQRRRLPMMAPARAVALYGPHAPLPRLPLHLHDPVSFAEAVAHQSAMQRLLRPLGLRVLLTGVTRRGCPVAREAEFTVTLSRQAARELEDRDAVEGVGEEREGRGRHADAFVAAPRVGDVAGLPTVACAHAEATAIADRVPPTVAHRYRRALQILHSAGHLVAAGRGPRSVRCSLRYDPRAPGGPPPFHVTDADTLAALRLHHAVLHFAPWRCHVARRFFQTGPAAFTAHLTLLALERGLELNTNGLFARGGQSATDRDDDDGSGGGGGGRGYRRVVLQSELELFRAVGHPYVDPLRRGVYCQQNNIVEEGHSSG